MTNQNDLAQQHSRATKLVNHWESRLTYYKQIWMIEPNPTQQKAWFRILEEIERKISYWRGVQNER